MKKSYYFLRGESWLSEAMISGNKLSGFPFCSATNGTFYQSRPAGKDFVFPHCSLILSSIELRCMLNTKPNSSVSINLCPPRDGAGFCLDCLLLERNFVDFEMFVHLNKLSVTPHPEKT